MEYLLLSQSQKYPLPQQTSLPPSTASSSSRNISPALLFIIVILAAVFFLSGLLHLLIRFLIKKSTSRSRSRRGGTQDFSGSVDALQRQLQQLFYLHDSGLDQASIDALPVFPYGEIVGGGGGSKGTFDCAVCLCEFLREDRLRLLPLCGHAFHLCCIDTWLLSNSTCPLCRGALLVQGVAVENPVFDSEEGEEASRLEEGTLGREVEVPVRLGKFRSTGNGSEGGNSIDESSSNNLDTRRCYSMGSYQYIVGDANLRVALTVGGRSGRRGRGKESSGNLDVTVGFEEEEEEEGKRLGAARKGESFSMSKIWLWGNKKGKLPDSSVSSGDCM